MSHIISKLLLSVFCATILYSRPSSAEKIKGTNLTEKLIFEKKKKVNESKLVRSNAPFFWSWVKAWYSDNESKLTPLEAGYVSPHGIIMGDAHLGNIHPFPDFRGPSKGVVWQNIDLDDGGIGPFAFDFLHFVISIKAFSSDVKIEDLTTAYVAGLYNSAVNVPKFVEKHLKRTEEDYEKERIEYVSKKAPGNKFPLLPAKHAELVEFDEKVTNIQKRDVTKVLEDQLGKDIKVLDLAVLPKESDGADRGPCISNSRRFKALVDLNNITHIYELKEMCPSGLSVYSEQKELAQSFNSLRDFYDYSAMDLSIVSLGKSLFEIREKKIAFFDVPYDQKNDEEVVDLKEMAYWGAYTLGKWHSGVGQTSSTIYRDAIKKDPTAFKDFIKKLKYEFWVVVYKRLGNNR